MVNYSPTSDFCSVMQHIRFVLGNVGLYNVYRCLMCVRDELYFERLFVSLELSLMPEIRRTRNLNALMNDGMQQK